MRIKAKVPECKTNDDGLFIPPYNVYNIGNGRPKRLLVFCSDFVRRTDSCRSPTC